MDIATLKKLAGINEFTGYSEYQLEENPSLTAAELKKKEADAKKKLEYLDKNEEKAWDKKGRGKD